MTALFAVDVNLASNHPTTEQAAIIVLWDTYRPTAEHVFPVVTAQSQLGITARVSLVLEGTARSRLSIHAMNVLVAQSQILLCLHVSRVIQGESAPVQSVCNVKGVRLQTMEPIVSFAQSYW